MASVGYLRVSPRDQNLNLQRNALLEAGFAVAFDEQISGAKTKRPGLNGALAYLRTGDVLVVWKLDRLGRSMLHLIETVNELEVAGIGFKSLTEQIVSTVMNG